MTSTAESHHVTVTVGVLREPCNPALHDPCAPCDGAECACARCGHPPAGIDTLEGDYESEQ